ncbi:MAG: hypothetical protein BGP12_15235 [Rhodospirillales bacterium 70-18]|nr:helix-turn-helix domain-containing protein [Rhodospirillales bacterium]OJY64449.1 MAG: hypothetical protein BGP12_15235 [Rhodospirillales bacterium 70-18]
MSLPPSLAVVLTIAQAADKLQLSIKTVRRLIAAHDLPAYRVGRQLRISESDLRGFLAQRRA